MDCSFKKGSYDVKYNFFIFKMNDRKTVHHSLLM